MVILVLLRRLSLSLFARWPSSDLTLFFLTEPAVTDLWGAPGAIFVFPQRDDITSGARGFKPAHRIITDN